MSIAEQLGVNPELFFYGIDSKIFELTTSPIEKILSGTVIENKATPKVLEHINNTEPKVKEIKEQSKPKILPTGLKKHSQFFSDYPSFSAIRALYDDADKNEKKFFSNMLLQYIKFINENNSH
jgi:hypothetical protein